jgi:hypothetical protein
MMRTGVRGIVDQGWLILGVVYVSQLLDRDELRSHCDKHRTKAAILANLGER